MNARPEKTPTTTPERLLRMRVNAAPHSVRRAHQDIMARLRKLSVPRATQNRIEVVLAEVMNNIVEHALRPHNAAAFSVHADRHNGHILFCFRDRGRPMPGCTAPPGAHPDLAVPRADMPEGGFGWVLIRALTDDLEYRREQDINKLTFRVALDADRAAPAL